MSPTSNIRRTESRFAGAGRRSLLRRGWLHGEPTRRIVLVHGFGEHSGRYEHVGAWFASRGGAVHAYDQRGHGESAGSEPGHVERFGDLLDDLDHFLALTEEEHPGLPCTLVGHSMGGLVVTAYARERQSRIDTLVTSGALLALGPDTPRAKVAAARWLRRVFPRLRMGAGVSPDALSRDPEVGRRYLADPLVFEKMTASLGDELLRAILRTAGAGRDISVPVLMLHGGDDPLCTPDGTRDFFSSLEEPEARGAALKIYPGLRHEIFNEPEQEQIFRDVEEWLRTHECDRIAPTEAEASSDAAEPLAGASGGDGVDAVREANEGHPARSAHE